MEGTGWGNGGDTAPGSACTLPAAPRGGGVSLTAEGRQREGEEGAVGRLCRRSGEELRHQRGGHGRPVVTCSGDSHRAAAAWAGHSSPPQPRAPQLTRRGAVAAGIPAALHQHLALRGCHCHRHRGSPRAPPGAAPAPPPSPGGSRRRGGGNRASSARPGWAGTGRRDTAPPASAPPGRAAGPAAGTAGTERSGTCGTGGQREAHPSLRTPPPTPPAPPAGFAVDAAAAPAAAAPGGVGGAAERPLDALDAAGARALAPRRPRRPAAVHCSTGGTGSAGGTGPAGGPGTPLPPPRDPPAQAGLGRQCRSCPSRQVQRRQFSFTGCPGRYRSPPAWHGHSRGDTHRPPLPSSTSPAAHQHPAVGGRAGWGAPRPAPRPPHCRGSPGMSAAPPVPSPGLQGRSCRHLAPAARSAQDAGQGAQGRGCSPPGQAEALGQPPGSQAPGEGGAGLPPEPTRPAEPPRQHPPISRLAGDAPGSSAQWRPPFWGGRQSRRRSRTPPQAPVQLDQVAHSLQEPSTADRRETGDGGSPCLHRLPTPPSLHHRTCAPPGTPGPTASPALPGGPHSCPSSPRQWDPPGHP